MEDGSDRLRRLKTYSGVFESYLKISKRIQMMKGCTFPSTSCSFVSLTFVYSTVTTDQAIRFLDKPVAFRGWDSSLDMLAVPLKLSNCKWSSLFNAYSCLAAGHRSQKDIQDSRAFEICIFQPSPTTRVVHGPKRGNGFNLLCIVL